MPVGTADWAYIKRRWEEGLSAPAIEKEIIQPNGKPAVTRQAILKRANKEGWLSGVAETSAAMKALVPGDGSNAVPPATFSEPAELVSMWAPDLAAKLAAKGKKMVSRERVERALNAYAVGGTHRMAAAMAGVTEGIWIDWRNECPELAAAIEELQAVKARRHLERIDKAGARGDWKADEALLKANPLTKGDWQQDKGGSSGVAIQINFGPNMPAEAMKVIDG